MTSSLPFRSLDPRRNAYPCSKQGATRLWINMPGRAMTEKWCWLEGVMMGPNTFNPDCFLLGYDLQPSVTNAVLMVVKSMIWNFHISHHLFLLQLPLPYKLDKLYICGMIYSSAYIFSYLLQETTFILFYKIRRKIHSVKFNQSR